MKKWTIFFLVILLSFQITNSQDKNGICNKMGKIKVVFHSRMTKDSLTAIQLSLLKKGVTLKYSDVHYDYIGCLNSIIIKVECQGCKMGGMCKLDESYFKKRKQNKGFIYDHSHSPYFVIGADVSKY